MNNSNDIVALSDSQILRWINELNGIENLDEKVFDIQRQIKRIKKEPKNIENKNKITELYDELYNLQYQKDYFCLIMDSNSDYDRANEGFKINGYGYKRLLGTNGGIKKSTITYIGENVYDEIKKRLNCGRNENISIVPAKLEAYQALICSASIPVSMPRILIVSDCYTLFKEDIIQISDNPNGGEAILEEIKDFEIEYCDSDGYGFMSPEYSRKINYELYGNKYGDVTVSGVNIRFAWAKGMLFTFDFIEFAKQKNNNSFMVCDAWGEWRDIRDYDVIMTTSMVKLWNAYDSLEQYIKCCMDNHYNFSVAKVTPHILENVRNANYQFLQDFEFTDKELYKLCEPTIREIKDVMGGDYRKAIVFLKGMYLNEDSPDYLENDIIKALMIDKRVMKDPFIVRKIHNMIAKRINMAAKGSIKLSGNFSIISGDLYSLAQHIFGLKVTGLLKAGEVYHKYWVDKGADEVACFRAPMTSINNVVKRRVVNNKKTEYWYQYVPTALILNSWDSTCDATNGSDKDSDTFFTTDNQIILKNTPSSKTIECMQRKAEKIIPTEKDIIKANKLAFGDEIGATTNRITSMIEVRARFEKDSPEYNELQYRIKCGQHFQQACIDRAKGIIYVSMPKYWYLKSACKIKEDDTEAEKQRKEFNIRIAADKKPYFMKYVYPEVMVKYNRYIKNSEKKCRRKFNMSIEDLRKKSKKTKKEKTFMEFYNRLLPVGVAPCVVNRICYLIENEFKGYAAKTCRGSDFDYSIFKSNAVYSNEEYLRICNIYTAYSNDLQNYTAVIKSQKIDKYNAQIQKNMLVEKFKRSCYRVCNNEKALCDMLLDLCYKSDRQKQFVWDICGDVIIDNLLEKNNYSIYYPYKVDYGDFEFGGEKFIMCKKIYKKEDDCFSCKNEPEVYEGSELL